jgi:hypothetical protein
MRDSTRARTKELGVIQALLLRLNTYRLPYARQLEAKVNRGETLSDYDMRFLKKVIEEGAEARRLTAKHPSYGEIVSRMMDLYSEIMRKGAENHAREKAGAARH